MNHAQSLESSNLIVVRSPNCHICQRSKNGLHQSFEESLTQLTSAELVSANAIIADSSIYDSTKRHIASFARNALIIQRYLCCYLKILSIQFQSVTSFELFRFFQRIWYFHSSYLNFIIGQETLNLTQRAYLFICILNQSLAQTFQCQTLQQRHLCPCLMILMQHQVRPPPFPKALAVL